MIKQIIYPCMALSLVLAPMTLAADITGDTTISSGTTLPLSNTDGNRWTGGKITNTGGTLTITGYTPTSTATPNYSQSAGALSLMSVTSGETVTGSTLTLTGTSSSGATISGGSVVIGDQVGSSYTTKNSLDVGNYASIADAAQLRISARNNLVVNGGEVTIGSNDTWEGNVSLLTGNLNINTDITTHGSGGATQPDILESLYNQTGGTLTIGNGSKFTLGGDEDTTIGTSEISGGNVAFSGTGNTIVVSDGGSIEKGASLNLSAGNTVQLNGNIKREDGSDMPSLVLDNNDTWNGKIENFGEGILELNGRTANKGTSATYIQNAGVLNLVGQSKFELNNAADHMKGGFANIGFIDEDAGISETGNELTISHATTAAGATHTLEKAVKVNLYQGNTLNINGDGTATLDGTGAAGDYWEGAVNLSGNGLLVLDGRDDTTSATKTYKQFVAEGSTGNPTLRLTNGTKLNLATSASQINAGTVELNNGSLTFANGLVGSAIVKTDTNDANEFTVTRNTQAEEGKDYGFILQSGSNITNGTVNVGKSGDAGLNTLEVGTGAKIANTAKVNIAQNNILSVQGGEVALKGTNTAWNGNVVIDSGKLTLDGLTKDTYYDSTTPAASLYQQRGGELTLTNGAYLGLAGSDPTIGLNSVVLGGKVNVGSGAEGDTGNTLVLNDGAIFSSVYDESGALLSRAQLNLNEGNTVELRGNYGNDPETLEAFPSMVLSNYQSKAGVAGQNDVWKGTIYTTQEGILKLEGFDNTYDSVDPETGLPVASESANLTYQQTGGSLVLGSKTIGSSETGTQTYNSVLSINNPNSYINGGNVILQNDANGSGINALILTTNTNQTVDRNGAPVEAMLGEKARVEINENTGLALGGNAHAILNDTNGDKTGTGDTWKGAVTVGSGAGIDSPTLTLRNVTKDFTKAYNPEDSTTVQGFSQNSGTLNVYANERGGSHLTYDGTNKELYSGGKINIKGYDAARTSSVRMNYNKDYIQNANDAFVANMQGNAQTIINTNNNTVTHANVNLAGTGPNNTLVKEGFGTYNLYSNETGLLNIGSNVKVKNGTMNVNADTFVVGANDGQGNLYGNLQVGDDIPTATTYFNTNAAQNIIAGDLILHDGWYSMTNPTGYTQVGGNMYSGSGVDMMQGAINVINVDGIHTVNNLDLKIDMDPQSGLADMINSAGVIANDNSRLNLADYRLLSEPTKEKYTFRVVNAANENYAIGENAVKTVTANPIVETKLGYYQVLPSSVNGAFDMALASYKPEIFRGQVAADIIYANQTVINNHLFDRMFFSNLPYFNNDCTNKTAAANTLFSPYQYTTNDTGLWFKPYGNFEKIHMNYGINVTNTAYGALVGADLAKKQWGAWSFIPTVYVGYNGGRATYNGVGMWQNGGQAGFMGTFTHKNNFISSFLINGGAYGNNMEFGGAKDNNVLWNAGIANKTAYNFQLPWHFVLQPTVYLAYNYVGGSSFNGGYDGFKHKVDALNAFTAAPGVNLIWQRETFNIYGSFQVMFPIGATVSGTVADAALPHVGIRDPYFEYGLGASKYFKDRFSGYAQATARSGSRKGIGFQLGMNMKL